jgi:hypothetical protein
MDSKTLQAVCKKVYQQYPEVRGASPKVKAQTSDTYLLVFQGQATTANGRAMRRTVRAVVTANGKITKLSASK